MSSTDSTNTASGSALPATPSPASIWLQNWWVVAIVAASNVARARVSRALRSAISASGASARRACTASAPARAAAGSASARCADSSRDRTRSRSSVVASRPNVTSISSGSVARPSAT